ncbi:MAG: long-chain fatty acid--CoA ligase [Bdellovibrionales bacterium]|nr:long-chain fatty acid--CoA ligase [Bdellovibrionales bacterium]
MSQTIIHFLLDARKRPPEHAAVTFKTGHSWIRWSWRDLYREVESLACFLSLRGLGRGDHIAILSSTRIEWYIADLAILGLGAVTVPLYTSTHENEIHQLLNHAEVKYLLCENQEALSKWEKIKNKCSEVKGVMVFSEGSIEDTTWTGWREAITTGRRFCQKEPDFFEKSIRNVKSEDLATIIYTSGTTDHPKGVALTHSQIMSEVTELFSLISVDHRDISLSFLPFAHILGRVESWGSLYSGFTMSFAENFETIGKNIQEIRPTILIGVPRVYEKIYYGIQTQIESNPFRHQVFKWAIKAGQKFSLYRLSKSSPPIFDLGPYLIAKKFIFDPLKKKLGGRLRFAISDGAPLNENISRFFHLAGILILEGYGLTETTAAVTINTPLEYELGTVGKPFGDVKIKLAEDGEILIKSTKILKEYYKNPAGTTEAKTHEGYLKTGDIGEWTHSGFLRITDRKKNLIKTSGGKYINPDRLEAILKTNRYISHALIHGDRRKYIVCLITLDSNAISEFIIKKMIQIKDGEHPSQNPQVIEIIREAVAEANLELASFESIKNFAVLPNDFSVATGELTPSMKIRRRFCDEKYKDVLDGLYGIDKEIV